MLQMLIIKTKEFLMGLGVREEQGQGLIEYALMIVLVAAVVVGVVVLLGEGNIEVIRSITGSLNNALSN